MALRLSISAFLSQRRRTKPYADFRSCDVPLSSRLAMDFVDKVYHSHVKCLNVLRLCCQDILAPAAIHLKRQFDEKASFSTSLCPLYFLFINHTDG